MALYSFNEWIKINSIYENWKKSLPAEMFKIYESINIDDDEFADEEDEERELTPGEKRAFAKGLQIMTDEQLAAIYLSALESYEGNPGEYLKNIPGIESFGKYKDDNIDRQYIITQAELADAIGLDSVRTLSYTKSKFINLLNGTGETESQTLYPKIIKAFNVFKEIDPNQLAIKIGDIIQDPSEFTKNRDAVLSINRASKESLMKRKAKEESISSSFYNLIKDLINGGIALQDSMKFAYKQLSSKYGIDPIKLDKIYLEYLNKKKIRPIEAYYIPIKRL
jgi:transcriptional regulator with XRE-family HTH domain